MFAGEWNTLSQPNSRVVGPCGVLMGRQDGSSLVSPTAIANCAAWYDLSDTTSLIKDSSDRIQLISDKSSNSGAGVGTTANKFLYLDGTSGTYASSSEYIPAGGVFRVEWKIDFDDYTPASSQAIVGDYQASAGLRSWVVYLYDDGSLRVALSADGTAITTVISSAAIPNGTLYGAVEIDLGAATTGTVDFETSSDGVTWSALGTQQTYSQLVLNNPASGGVEIGTTTSGTGLIASGKFGYVKLSLDGTLVRDFDFTAQQLGSASFTESSSNAATVTLNGTAVISYCDGVQPTSTAMVIDGSSGAYASTTAYIPSSGVLRAEVNALLDDYTPAANGAACGVWNTTGDQRAWRFILTTTGELRFLITTNGGTGTIAIATCDTALTDGTLYYAFEATLSTGDVDFFTSSDGATWTKLGATINYGGGIPDATSTADFEVGASNAGTADFLAGDYYSVKVYQDGTLVRDIDFVGNDVTSQTFVEGEGETVTLNGTARWSYGSSGGTNALELPQTAANYASFTALFAFGTGDLSVSAKVNVSDLSAVGVFFGGGAASFNLRYNTDGTLVTVSPSVGTNTASTGALSVFDEVVVGYTRSGTTGIYYLDGVAIGTITDSINYSVGISELGTHTAGTFSPMAGALKWARVYDAALDATAMAADAAGTVQANNIFNVDFGLAPKLATSFTALTGQTVTINQTSIALPARIHGARDLYQGLSASQPIYLPWDGQNYGYLNGVSGNNFSTPDSAALEIPGDIDIRVHAKINAVGTTEAFASRDNLGAARVWYFSKTVGVPTFRWVESGGTARFVQATQNLTTVASNGDEIWVRVTLDVNDGAGNFLVKFYTSPDGTNWTQLGSTVAGGVVSSIRTDQAIGLAVGAQGDLTSNTFSGKIYRALVLDGIDGTTAADFNPADYPAVGGLTFPSSTTGETWTINGGAKIVNRTGAYFDGTADYMKTAPFSLSQPENVYFVGEQVTSTLLDTLIDGSGQSTGRIFQGSSAPSLALNAGVTLAYSDEEFGVCQFIEAIFNGATSVARINRNAAVTGNGGSADMGAVTVGATGIAGNFGNIFVSEILIYDTTAHTTSTQDRLALYAGRKWRFSV